MSEVKIAQESINELAAAVARAVGRDQGSTTRDMGRRDRGDDSGDRDFSGTQGGILRQQYASLVGNLPGLEALKTGLLEIDSLNEGTLGRIMDLQEQMGGLAGDMGQNLLKGENNASKFAETMFQVNDKLYGGESSVDGLNQSLSRMIGELPEAIEGLESLVLGAESSSNAFRILKHTSADEMSDMALEMGVFGTKMGLDTREVTAFITRQMDLHGKASSEMLVDAAIASKRVADATGDSSKEIMNITAALVADTQRYGNVSVQEAARIGGSLRQLGLDYSELNGMVDKFFNFDNAVSSVSALTSVFGVQLDAMDMMMMANEDQGAMMEYVREQFLATGKSVEDMGLAEKKLIQQQLGLKSVSAVERLFDPTADLTAMDELGTDAELTAGSVQESMSELANDIMNYGMTAQGAIDRFADQGFKAYVASQQRQLVMLSGQFEEFAGMIEKNVQGAAVNMASATGDPLASIVGSIGGEFEKLNKSMAEGIAAAFKDIPEKLAQVFKEAIAKIKELEIAKTNSPETDLGLLMAGGVTAAFSKVPEEVSQYLSQTTDKATESYSTQMKNSESELKQWADTVAKLGIEFDDLGAKQQKQLLEKYNITEDRMKSIMGSDATAVAERNKVQRIEALLEKARGEGGIYENDQQGFERYAKSLFTQAGDLLDSEKDAMFKSLGKDQDTIFQTLMNARKRQEEAKKEQQEAARSARDQARALQDARGPREESTGVDQGAINQNLVEARQRQEEAEREQQEAPSDPNAQQNANNATDSLHQASAAQAEAIENNRKALEALTKLVQERKSSEVTVKLEPGELTLNLKDPDVEKAFAKTVIRGSLYGDARAGTQEQVIQLASSAAGSQDPVG